MNTLAMTALGGLVAAVTVSGCAGVNRTRPGDMTVAEHEQAARAEGKGAEEASARAGAVGRGAESERYDATRHRELAKEHAVAAERRRAQVTAACEGVVVSIPFTDMHVERVDAIHEASTPPQARHPRGYYPERLKGARVVLTTPGGADSTVVRSIACEAARDSAGLGGPAAAGSPLAVATARTDAKVGPDSSVIVEIRSADEDDAVEILQRAEAMAKAPARR